LLKEIFSIAIFGQKMENIALPSNRPNGGQYFWNRVRRNGLKCLKRIQENVGSTKRKNKWPNYLRRLGRCKIPWNIQIYKGRKILS
jgi:hypothetical protein